jgi:hypothetical protein
VNRTNVSHKQIFEENGGGFITKHVFVETSVDNTDYQGLI